MLGGMLAGTDECEGEWAYHWETLKDGSICQGKKRELLFYGMSSEKAQNKHNDGMNDYATSEGRVKKVPYKGKVDGVVRDICGGVRSACAYTGATSLKDFSKTARFVRVNRTHTDQSL